MSLIRFKQVVAIILALETFTAAAQNINWGSAQLITGDTNLLTNGTYFDALIPNHGPLTADGVTFNQDTHATSTGGGDLLISYVVTSGNNNSYGYNTLFTGGSSDFNAIMNAGGTYQFGGAGAGTVTINGLTSAHIYQVQVFNYAGDGDTGLTTFSGVTPVTLSTMVGGVVTQGQFAMGTFTAISLSETFNWAGAGSAYTVLGAISVRDLGKNNSIIVPTVSPTNVVTLGTVAALAVNQQAGQTYYQWQTDNGSSGANWSNIPGANNTNYILDTINLAIGSYEYQVIWTNNAIAITSVPVTMTVIIPSADNIAWGNAIGITGDANLATGGTYFDALMPNTSISSPLSVNGIAFNTAAALGGNNFGDGKISYSASGVNDFSWPNSFPVSASASTAFAALMNAGGIFQNGGAGTGTVTISSLVAGHNYLVQAFSYAPDGDAGLTTLSGTTPVMLSNLPGAGGINTYGEFSTGTFTATTNIEIFNWAGADSSYTVIGSILVRDVTTTPAISPTNIIYQGDAASLTVNAQPIAYYYQWQTDNRSGGASWNNISGANNTNYVLATSSLSTGNYQFRVVVTNINLNTTSAPVAMTLLPSSAPVILQNPAPTSANPYVGQSVTFTALFNGNHPITNQWEASYDGGNTFTNLAEATNTTLTLSNVQLTDSGLYRVAATNAFGANDSAAATLTVKPWSAAHIQWSEPVSCLGLNAGEILTNVPGAYLGAATFFNDDSAIAVNVGAQQYVFRSDGAVASLTGGSYYSGKFLNNAIYGSGVWVTNTTGDNNFDAVLNQYFDGGFTNLITLHNLTVGQQYSVQLFALDNRGGNTDQPVNFADVTDAGDVSTTFAMGDNAYMIGTFVATNTNQIIRENLLDTNGFGNINAIVVRALSYTPSIKPTIVIESSERFLLATGAATFRVIADGAPSPIFQWKAGPTGGPYTNLMDGGRYSGALTSALNVFGVATNDNLEFVVGITNTAGGVVSAPVTLQIPVIAQADTISRPVRITCVGASDVSTPTPYGTPNWPDYITSMLGYGYVITNCGASGTTMMKDGNAPYWNTPQFTDGTNLSPDIVIIMLGSNDSKSYNWVNQTNYVPDYESMIDTYRNLPSHPRIYLNTLLTVYNNGNYDITDPIVTGQLCPIIKQIAFDENLPINDINAATKNMPQNFPDNVHPDIAGAKVVAQTIFNGLLSAGEAPPLTDLALNRPSVASSTANGNVATNAVDNDYSTEWSSAASDNQWVYVDLGSITNVSGVCLNWGSHYASSYKIQVSNDALNWTDVYTNNAGVGGIDRITVNATGRYIRMLGIHSGAGNGYSLLDLTVTASESPPVLVIMSSANMAAQLSWKNISTGFVVETTSNLSAPASWTPWPSPVSITNGSNFVAAGFQGTEMFFRLKQKLIE